MPHLVIDVPEGTTAEQAEALLNAPGDSYFCFQVLPVAGSHRAYLRSYKQTPTKAEVAEGNAEKVGDATALSILRANPGKSVRVIESLLQAAGIKRGRRWVLDQIDVVRSEDGNEEKAMAFLKEFCDPNEWTPEDVVVELQYDGKIKRSKAWARRKLEELKKLLPGNDS